MLHVTNAPPVDPASLDALARLLEGRRTVALTGAGCSTESGIPDYRGPGTRERARSPIQHREFLARPEVRQRYWARSLVGWPRFCAARPNTAHAALAALEHEGLVAGLVTQNVDRLHQAAGSARVIELHGALERVRCLACEGTCDRGELQRRLLALNPHFAARALLAPAGLRPDGDAELTTEALAAFRVADCEACGGVLKPDVVFFGDHVPVPTVEAAYALVDCAEVLLVVGTSLAVFSGFRFVRRAHERGIPVALVNLGETRADPYTQLRVEGRAGDVLPPLARALGCRLRD